MPWYAKQVNGYLTSSAEATANATETVNILQGRGFSLASCCAILGNIADEGGYNPWRWQGDNVQSVNNISVSVGYGLFQYTPPTKYINATNRDRYLQDGYAPNFSDYPGDPQDGKAQLEFMADQFTSSYFDITTGSGQIRYNNYYPYFQALNPPIDITPWFNISAAEFQTGQYFNTSTDIPLEDLTGAFELCWEGPAYSGAATHYAPRINAARYWADYFDLNPPTPPTPVTRKKMPLWMMLRRYL